MSHAQNTYPGFDKNGYPGDDLLPALHKAFAYSGYWLNNPPEAASNPWQGKRAILVKSGFGFLILFNGRLESELKDAELKGAKLQGSELKQRAAAALGRADAAAAVAAAQREGFPTHAIIFLDVEEGGRLLPDQLAYVLAWTDALHHSDYRPGVYCSGIPVPDGPGRTITTAHDLQQHDPSIFLWVANDVCPPAPGCVLPPKPLALSSSGTKEALVWQYAQSPRRPQFTSRCGTTYAADNNCYAPGTPKGTHTFIDLNIATSPDPSAGR